MSVKPRWNDPAGNGTAERGVQTVKSGIKALKLNAINYLMFYCSICFSTTEQDADAKTEEP